VKRPAWFSASVPLMWVESRAAVVVSTVGFEVLILMFGVSDLRAFRRSSGMASLFEGRPLGYCIELY